MKTLKELKKFKTLEGKYKCPYCGKEFSKKGIISHIWRSHTEEGKKHGTQIYKNYKKGSKKAWNKGLTKETDERVKKGSDTAIENNKNRDLTGHKHSEETKRKISEARIKILEESPHINWYDFNGFKVQGKWELNVGNRLLELGFNPKRSFIVYNKIKRYTPDFNLSKNVYVEVKGWFKDFEIEKYYNFFLEHENIKIYLIREPFYSKFINGEIVLEDCEDLKEVVLKLYPEKDSYKTKRILKEESKIQRVERPKKYCKVCGKEIANKNNKSYCSQECCTIFKSRNIPSKEEILKAFEIKKSFIQVGKYFGVANNTVKKWCKRYNIKRT